MRILIRLTLLAAVLLAPSTASAAGLPSVKLPVRVTLPGTLPAYVSRVPSVGAAAPGGKAQALIALRHRDQAGLQRFIAKVSNPRSSSYGHYLTPKQFTARYAPRTATVRAVETFARSLGLTVALGALQPRLRVRDRFGRAGASARSRRRSALHAQRRRPCRPRPGPRAFRPRSPAAS